MLLTAFSDKLLEIKMIDNLENHPQNALETSPPLARASKQVPSPDRKSMLGNPLAIWTSRLEAVMASCYELKVAPERSFGLPCEFLDYGRNLLRRTCRRLVLMQSPKSH